MDFTDDHKLEPEYIQIGEAVDKSGQDVKTMLLKDDNEYYTQKTKKAKISFFKSLYYFVFIYRYFPLPNFALFRKTVSIHQFVVYLKRVKQYALSHYCIHSIV